MKEQDILLALEDLARSLCVSLRYEKGDFEGGYCRVDQDNVIIIHAMSTRKKKINILARELNRFNLDEVFIVPAVRKIIDREKHGEEDKDLLELEEKIYD